MPRPFLVLQLRPEDAASDNEFAAILRFGDLQEHETRRIRIEKAGIPEVDLADYSAIIVGGSPFDISTPEPDKAPIQRRIEADFRSLFDRVVPADFPFLGACSGNGLLGHYLGAPISGRYREPVGGATVEITEAGQSDPLLAGFPSQIRVLLGHKEACDHLPEAATLLVRGDRCPVQMFRVGENVYATQFHPEGDPEGFSVRINCYKSCGYFPESEAESLIRAVSRERTPQAQEILKRFVARYRAS